jgi:transcriptional regulator with XRE-family HTH domain
VGWPKSEDMFAAPPGPFSGLLRRYREAAGLTQEGLSVRSGLSVRAISDLERDRTRKPHQQTVLLLAAALELDDSQASDLLAVSRGTVFRGTGAPATGPAPPGPDDGARRLDSGLAAPQQLPMSVAHFVGRTTELAALSALAQPSADVVTVAVIGGLPGVGKSSLAIHWAHSVKQHFPDGQVHIDLRGFDPVERPLTATEAIYRVLRSFQVPPGRIPADLDGQVALYRSLLAGQQVLLVADNARDADQVRPLLPGSPGCVVVVTSRQRLTSLVAVEGARPITLDELPATDSWDLLTRLLGPRRVMAEPGAARELIRQCGGLPLALSIIAARAAVRPALPLALLATEMRERGNSLDAFRGGNPAADLRTAFGSSWQQLSDRSREVFRLLALHPGREISVRSVAKLASIPASEAAAVLASLSDTYLIIERGSNRFKLHKLLQAYAAEQFGGRDSCPARDAAGNPGAILLPARPAD